MSNTNDFIIEDGILKVYRGAGGDIVIPDEVTGFLFVFAEFWEPFTLTLSKNMKANYDTLLSPGIVTVNIPAGTELECPILCIGKRDSLQQGHDDPLCLSCGARRRSCHT